MIARRFMTRPRDRHLLSLILSAGGGLIIFVAAAWLGGARLWGRHLMFMVPIIFLTVAIGLQNADLRRLQTICIALLMLMLIWGAMRQRFLPDYGKDPFREAMAQIIVRHASDPIPVIWVAYGTGIEYYASRCGAAPAGHVPGWIRDGNGWDPAAIRSWNDSGSAYYLLMHRPDVCDPAGAWTAALRTGRVVWEKRGMRLFHVPGRIDILRRIIAQIRPRFSWR